MSPPAAMSTATSETTARRSLPAEFGVSVVLAVVFIYFAWKTPVFRSMDNLRLLAKQSAQLAVVATGMTLVIATGGIDISVGSLVGLCGMVLAWLTARAGWSLGMACVGAVVAGGLCGLFNGVLIARAKLPPIIVTLATFAAARAAVALFNDGGGISDPRLFALNDLFDRTNILGLPILFWIGILTLAAGGILLRRTTFGRELLALGGNRTATQLSGVPVVRTETLVYVLSGALAGFASILNTALAASAEPNAGQFLELIAITAVVLGGTAITGGQATVVGTGLGVLTIGALLSGVRSNGLPLLGREDQVAWFLIGAALLLAVEVQKWRARKAS